MFHKLAPAYVREQQINSLPNIRFIRWAGAYRDNTSKAICRCAVDGYEWSVAVGSLISKGRGCPQCAGQRRWTAEEMSARIDALPNVSFIKWASDYKGAKSKAICRCALYGHEWATRADVLLSNGSGCPQCAIIRSSRSAEETSAEINELENITFVRWADEYRNNRSKAICRCGIDGYEWAARVGNLLTGKGCPQCAGTRSWTAEERIAQINALPNISFVRWDGGYTGSKSKAVSRCDIDGFEWSTTVSNLLKPARTGCPQCAGKRRWTAEDRIAQINALPNISFVRWLNGYRTCTSKAICKCTVDGFEWSVAVGSLISKGRGCPKCAESGYDPAKPGTLYFLRSECGSMVKIGISNDYRRRHKELSRYTPFNWSCIELIHSDDGGLIADFEKEFHRFTAPVNFGEPFPGYTEWRKWDDRLPMWVKRHRARLAR